MRHRVCLLCSFVRSVDGKSDEGIPGRRRMVNNYLDWLCLILLLRSGTKFDQVILITWLIRDLLILNNPTLHQLQILWLLCDCWHYYYRDHHPHSRPPPTQSPYSYQHSTTMAELTVQSERAFLKQPHIFQNPKTAGKTKEKRWYKDVGLGFKTPKEAIEGTYIGTFAFTLPYSFYRQEVSFYWSNLDPRPYPFWHCCIRKDAPYRHHSVTGFLFLCFWQ